MQICQPCTWCGLFTGRWCDGMPPARHTRGWQCKHALCSFCEGLMGLCKWCSVWQAIPAVAPEGVRLHFRDGPGPWDRHGPLTMGVLENGEIPPWQEWPSKLREAYQLAADVPKSMFLSLYLSELGCGRPGCRRTVIASPVEPVRPSLEELSAVVLEDMLRVIADTGDTATWKVLAVVRIIERFERQSGLTMWTRLPARPAVQLLSPTRAPSDSSSPPSTIVRSPGRAPVASSSQPSSPPSSPPSPRSSVFPLASEYPLWASEAAWWKISIG